MAMEPKPLRVKSSSAASKDETNGSEEDCSICCQPYTFKATLPDCGHSFCFLCIKGVARRHGVCPLCRKPIFAGIFRDPILTTEDNSAAEPSCSQAVLDKSSLKDCSIEEKEESKEEVPQSDEKSAARWFYQARHGGWWRYEQRQEHDIEKAFLKGDRQIELLIAGYTYCINFSDRCQYRKDLGRSPHWERAVKRVEGDELDGEIRGIAGLRTPSNDVSTHQITASISKVQLHD
uniref:E3 ubiquitin-protein ligase n=1 Tax=Ascaris suum TaxID=6253 RepID=F1LCK5_ASCSU